MTIKDEIRHRFANTEIDPAWSFADCKPSDTGKWTHDYHRYPAKFIPQLVEKLIDEYITSPQAHINDPFHGCGTTIVTAIARGFQASGTDINRIAHLITKVKATPIPPPYLASRLDAFFARLGHNPEPLIPENHQDRIHFWFNEENQIRLGQILRVIHEEEDVTIREFLLVGFSHILKNCSWWSLRSTKPTRDPRKVPPNPADVLKKHLFKMKNGNEAFHTVVPPRVREDIHRYLHIKTGSAKQQPAADRSVDLIITSSPYVTSYEYADLHQLSTIWLGLADDLRGYKKEFIGTAHKQYEDRPLQSEIARMIVNQLMNRDTRMAKSVEAFFLDMQDVFSESYRILKAGGRCCYVIGNTRLKGIDILNAEVFAESLIHAGFRFDRLIKREIPAKILPQKRDEVTGKFASNHAANAEAYPVEYIVIGLKE